MMTTTIKIKKLGRFYKQRVDGVDAIDMIQNESLPVEAQEELLTFARAICGRFDEPMKDIVDGLRAVLENEVHTEAGR